MMTANAKTMSEIESFLKSADLKPTERVTSSDPSKKDGLFSKEESPQILTAGSKLMKSIEDIQEIEPFDANLNMN